jgi:hypothetical protein
VDPRLIDAVESVAEPNWTAVLQAIGAIGSLVVAVIGFVVVIRQVRQVRQALHGDTHSKLYTEVGELLKLFLVYPDLRGYFYSGRQITTEDPEYNRVYLLAEAFVGHFEHVVLQEENLPDHIRPRWIQYIQDMYSTSPIICQHMTESAGWYSDRLHEIVQSVQPAQKQAPGWPANKTL